MDKLDQLSDDEHDEVMDRVRDILDDKFGDSEGDGEGDDEESNYRDEPEEKPKEKSKLRQVVDKVTSGTKAFSDKGTQETFDNIVNDENQRGRDIIDYGNMKVPLSTRQHLNLVHGKRTAHLVKSSDPADKLKLLKVMSNMVKKNTKEAMRPGQHQKNLIKRQADQRAKKHQAKQRAKGLKWDDKKKRWVKESVEPKIHPLREMYERIGGK
jgi:hypothetical protein